MIGFVLNTESNVAVGQETRTGHSPQWYNLPQVKVGRLTSLSIEWFVSMFVLAVNEEEWDTLPLVTAEHSASDGVAAERWTEEVWSTPLTDNTTNHKVHRSL